MGASNPFENGGGEVELSGGAVSLVPNDPSGRCRVDGVAFSCAQLGRMLAMESVVLEFVTLRFRNPDTHEVRWVQAQYAPGAGGYMPIGVGRIFGPPGEYGFRFGDGAWGIGRVLGYGAQTGGGRYTGTASLGGGLPGRLPQNPRVFDREQARSNIQKILNTGDCAEWIKNLINKAAELYPDNPPAFTDPLKYFDNIKFNVGNHGIGQGVGNVLDKEKGATIYVPDLTAPIYNNVQDWWYQQEYALIVLHEIIHLAGGKGSPSLGYSDYELARAADQLPGSNMMPPWSVDLDRKYHTMQGYVSDYWNEELVNHCNLGRDTLFRSRRGPVK